MILSWRSSQRSMESCRKDVQLRGLAAVPRVEVEGNLNTKDDHVACHWMYAGKLC